MSNTRTPLITLTVALVLIAAACGADGPDEFANEPIATVAAPASPSPEGDIGETDAGDDAAVEANGETVDVVALDNTFRPDSIEIVAGTAVRWENRGRNDHDVLPADESQQWGVDVAGFAPGDVYTLLFDTPGEYPYFCSIHGTKDVGMVGTIVVLPAEG
jgi:plastocyanin